MFREFKEYQDIVKLYQNNVYQSNEDIIKEAFASEEFTEEEAIFLEQNFDAIIEQIITEEEILTEQPRVKNPTPTAKTTSVPSSTIQGKAGGVMGKVKSALGKVGSKIKDVAKTAVKTGTAPLKSGQGAGKMVGKGAKLLSKMGPAGKAAAVATLAGGAIAAGLAARNKNATSKQVDKYVADRKGSKPIRKIDPAPFNKREKAEPVKSATASEPVVSDKTKQGKPRTKAQMMAAKRIASGKTIQDVKDANTDAMQKRAAKRFADFKAKREAKRLERMKKEEYTPYDMVLEYLLSSEQAATIEEANYVMMQLDEENIQEIVRTIMKTPLVKLVPAAIGTGIVTKMIASKLGQKSGENEIQQSTTPVPVSDKNKKKNKGEDLLKQGIEVIKKAKENPGTGLNPNTREALKIMNNNGY